MNEMSWWAVENADSRPQQRRPMFIVEWNHNTHVGQLWQVLLVFTTEPHTHTHTHTHARTYTHNSHILSHHLIYKAEPLRPSVSLILMHGHIFQCTSTKSGMWHLRFNNATKVKS